MDNNFIGSRFRHEIEWYDYYYIESKGKVMVMMRDCIDGRYKRWFYSREEVERRIAFHKFNPFLQPIFQEALLYFPGGEKCSEMISASGKATIVQTG